MAMPPRVWRGSDRPSLDDLYHVVKDAAPKWRNLGEALLPYEQHAMLNVFAVDHPHDDRSCCICVLERWLDTDPDATWNELIRALKVGGFPDLVNDFKPRITESHHPTLKQIRNILKPDTSGLATRWYDLGTQLLNDSTSVLDVIKADHPNDTSACCNKMFVKWLKLPPKAPWSELIKALSNIGMNTAEEQIIKHFKATESEGNNSVEGAVIIDEIQDKNVAPKMKDINRYITTKYHYDWKNIGLELDLDYRQLDVIEIAHKDNKAKFLDMISFWIQRSGVATWKALEVALTNVKRQELGLGPVDDVYASVTASDSAIHDDHSSDSSSTIIQVSDPDISGSVLHSKRSTDSSSILTVEEPIVTLHSPRRRRMQGIEVSDQDISRSVLHSKRSTDSSSIVTEDLTCPVCYQLYKKPKYLSCHHSYCEECLEGMQVESKIICPECRAESVLPTGGVKDLPADFRINSMMDRLGLKRKEDVAVLNCSECVEDEPVVAYCKTCSSYLCQFCYEYHKRSKRFCDHTTTVTKLRSNKHVNIQPKAVSLTCKDHDIETLFYCETCEQLVCKRCLTKIHHGHSYAKARIQACKCQIELEAIATVKMVAEDLSEAHNTIDEIKKRNKEVVFPTKENSAGAAFVMCVDGPYQISCDGQGGGYYMWNDCGLEINFPPKCAQQHIQLTTNAFLPVENEVYPGVHIVSAVYQFNCNIERFDKAVTLRLQHCVNLQSPGDCQKMRFVIMQDGGNDVKYGNFEVGKSYGTVALNQFCHIFILWIGEPWKNIQIIVLPLSGAQGDSSQQVPSGLSSNSGSQAYSVGLSSSRTDHRRSSQAASRQQQHDSSESVPPNSNASPAYKYEAMIGLPKDHRQLNEWSGFYSIYVDYGTWRKVCKESIQMEELIRNHTINFYVGKIDFDADGVAKAVCEQSPEAVLDVECTPYQITKMEINKKYEDYVKKCRMHPLYTQRENFVRTVVHKSRIDVANLTGTQPSNFQLTVKGIDPQLQVDLCTDHCTNLTLINDPQPSNAGPVSAGPGLKASDIHIDISPRLKQCGILDKKPKMNALIIMEVVSLLAAKWETVAYILDYDTTKINTMKASKDDPEDRCQELLRHWVEEKHDDAPKTWFTLLNTIAENKAFIRSIERILEKLEKRYAS